MHQFTNLPKPGGSDVFVEALDDYSFHVYTTSGMGKITICHLQSNSREGLAREIADAITHARDTGYRQHRQDFLDFIGAEPKT